MRSRTDNWFECKIKYEKMQEDGTQKKVAEQYVVEALTWGEAEKRVMEETTSFVSGAFEVSDIKKASYGEVFFADNDISDKWYKTKVQFITIDEKTCKEKRSNIIYLVNAGSFDGASKALSEIMKDCMADFVKSNISDTMIMDVYEYSKKD